MTESQNSHFKLLASGLSQEPLAQLGEALLALQQARQASPAEASAAWLAAGGRLDNACQALLGAMLEAHGTELNAQQWLFAESGALDFSIPLKGPDGSRSEIELLPPETYSLLLADSLTAADGDSDAADEALAGQILSARERIGALLSGSLEALDLGQDPRARGRNYERSLAGRQGRAAPGAESKRPASDLSARQHEEALKHWQRARHSLEQAQQKLSNAVRNFAASVSAQKLNALLSETGEILHLCQQALTPEAAQDPTAAELQDLPDAAVLLGGSIEDEASTALLSLARARRECSQALLDLRLLQSALSGSLPARTGAAGGSVASALQSSGLKLSPPPAGQLSAQQLERINADFKASGELMRQSQQQLRRSGTRCGRPLLSDYFPRASQEGLSEGSFASRQTVRKALAKLMALHTNCFPLDQKGRHLLPPIIIEPGVSTAIWLDDRFLLAFTHVQAPMVGAQLSLSAVDQALLRLMGLYLARGEIFNYRGERLRDSFMGEYAGETEQKAVVKFAGPEKRITYASSSAEKDSAGREDAVRDYIDFIFCVYNGLPLPKRISTRRAGVLLKYVQLQDPAMNVRLALRLLYREEPQLCREVLQRLAGRNSQRLLELIAKALEGDTQLNARYREGADQVLREVMGREYAEEAQEKKSILELQEINSLSDADGTAEAQPQSKPAHNYFEL